MVALATFLVTLLTSACSSFYPAVETTPSSGSQSGEQSNESDVIVQLFNWPFSAIASEVDRLAELGYTHIHVSPPQLSIATKQWWGRYQPVDYRVFEGPLGNEADFRNMISAAHARGLKVIADVVLNHMANFDNMTTGQPYSGKNEELEYPPHAFREKFGLSLLFSSEHFNKTGCTTDWNNRYMVVHFRLCDNRVPRGLPDLNLSHPHVLAMHKRYLQQLKGMGVDGIRIDAMKHMNEDYFERLLTSDIVTPGFFVFGEVIASQHTFKQDMEPYLRLTRARLYDFPLVHTMKTAFNYGESLAARLVDPVRSEQALEGNRAVTFVVNHDIPTNGSTFSYLLFDQPSEQMAFAYIFGRRDGVPYVFSDLGFSPETGIESDRFKNYHRRTDMAAMIKFRNLTKGSHQQWLLTNDTALVWSRGGRALVAINKSGSGLYLDGMYAPLEDGEYLDLISRYYGGNSDVIVRVKGGKVEHGHIPGRRAAMLVKF